MEIVARACLQRSSHEWAAGCLHSFKLDTYNHTDFNLI